MAPKSTSSKQEFGTHQPSLQLKPLLILPRTLHSARSAKIGQNTKSCRRLLGVIVAVSVAIAWTSSRTCNLSFVPLQPVESRLGHTQLNAATAAPAVPIPSVDGSPLVGEMRKSGGGGGGGPTPFEVAQIFVYRAALVICAVLWLVTFNLDFFMRGGLSDFIDGSLQRQCLGLADICAGIAALVVPAGSRLVAGVALRILGAVTLSAAAFGFAGLDSLGSIGGPTCIILICAREIYWFGLQQKIASAVCAVLFLIVATFRYVVVADPASPLLNPEDDGAQWSWMQRGIPCVGPPLLLSFPTTIALSGVAWGKVLLESVTDDLNEEGDLWSKPGDDDEGKSV